MMNIHPQCRQALPALLLSALLVSACSDATGTPDADAGTDAGGQDGGSALTWPAPSASFAGHQPALAVQADGEIRLAYESEGQVWLRLNPASSDAPLQLGTGVNEDTLVLTAASPDEDTSLVAWRYGNAVWIDGDVASLSAKRLVDSFDVAENMQLTWTNGQPLLVMEDPSGTTAKAARAAAMASPGAAT